MSTPDTTSGTVGFRLSPQQEQLVTPGGGAPAQCAALIAGPVDEARLRSALEHVVQRHEILRTTFAQPAGMRGFQQIIHERLAPGWSREAAGAPADPGALHQVLDREAQPEPASDPGPAVRAALIADGDADGLLVLTVAGGCADPTSLLRLLDELAEAYHQDAEPADPEQSADPVQYADYAQWRHELLTEEAPDADAGRAFWRDEAIDRPVPPPLLFGTWAPSGGAAPVTLPVDLSGPGLAGLAEAATGAGVTVAVFLEAAWHALLARLSGAGELLVAGWSDGRLEADLAEAIGCYAQPGPIRSRFEAGTSFAEILDQVRRARAGLTRRQDYATASDLSAVTGDAGIGFSALRLPSPRAPFTQIVALHSSPAPVSLMLTLRLSDAGPEAELSYAEPAFDRADAEDLARRLRSLLAAAIADPGQPVARLAITEPEERDQILAGSAGPAPAQAPVPFHHRFEAQAKLTPDRTAVAARAGRLTYAELNRRANQLAHHLRELGVRVGDPVGLCLERSPAMLVALLGIVKAGGAYLPLNFEHPVARLAHQLTEAGASILVTEDSLLERLESLPVRTVCPADRDAEELAGLSGADPEPLAGPEDLVYVMYTSGSTGTPKGVAVTHANLSNYATDMVQRLGLPDADGAADMGLRFGVASAISTDLGNTGIFPPLISGGCVQLIGAEASMDADALLADLDGDRLDLLKITPSHLRALLAGRSGAGVIPRRTLVLGGEALTWDLVQTIRTLAPGCRIVNHYGPTETTIGCCTYDVDAERRADAATVPIGAPITGTRAYILDGADQPLPPGVAGELCIAGAGVAAGYRGGAGDSDGRFGADPFAGEPGAGARLYRTGDRARRLRDGAIEFLGRVDDQVKIRGFRIEPGEIEAALILHPAIRQAAVTAEPDERGALRLVAYLVSSQDPSVEQMQAFLAETLPDYMIPATFATLEVLPLTPSGKLDRRALPELGAVGARREAEFVAPRDATEEEIAAIWCELLGVERVGVFDDFFALGGHSLLATQAIMRIRRVHGAIPLRALLAAPTVAALAEVVRDAGED